MQQPKQLCPKLRPHEADTGDIAARPVEAGDEAEFDRVAAAYEDDRDRRSRRLGCNCRGGVVRGDHCHLTAYQIGCEVGQSIVLVLRPAILDRHVPALDVAGLAQALAECGHKVCSVSRRRAAEEPDHRHRWLLRTRRARPRERCTAERGYELPSSDVDCHLTRLQRDHARCYMGQDSTPQFEICDRLHGGPTAKRLAIFPQCKCPFMALSGGNQGGEFTSAFEGVAEVHGPTASAAFEAYDPQVTCAARDRCTAKWGAPVSPVRGTVHVQERCMENGAVCVERVHETA